MNQQSLPVALSPWIIQDGNYGEFAVGDVSAFALEFLVQEPLKRAFGGKPSLQYLGDSKFSVIARVLYRSLDWWALDFGYLAYSELPGAADLKTGEMVQGCIWLGIDPFSYFERLSVQPDCPPLIFDWRIERIEMLAPPHMERNGARGGKPGDLVWRDIERTDAWSADHRDTEYVLHCKRLEKPPRRTLEP